MDIWTDADTIRIICAAAAGVVFLAAMIARDLVTSERHRADDATEDAIGAHETCLTLRHENARLKARLAVYEPAPAPAPKPTWRTIAAARQAGVFDQPTRLLDTRRLHTWIAEHDDDPIIWAAPEAVDAARDTRRHPAQVFTVPVLAVAS